MPPVKLKNLIIFGDSMSDIGNKREQGMGKFARALGLMRTNEVGRFSDGRNWTDFLWQWAGGTRLIWKDQATSLENTVVHRSLTKDSSQDSGFGRPFFYCNYAEGGAMGASDRSAVGLGTFKEQVLRYIEDREKCPLEGPTMHILWFGLNDLVTNGRPPDTMGGVVDELGTGMRTIDMHFGQKDSHYLVMNLPSPAGAVRLLKQNDLRQVAQFDKGALLFNKHLEGLNGMYYDDANNVTLVDMYSYVDNINNNLEDHGLVNKAQPHGVKVDYGMFGEDGDKDNNVRKCVATSDDAHPTEAVYKLMARHVAKTLRTRYDLGTLGKSLLA